jgi:hypothetical protein
MFKLFFKTRIITCAFLCFLAFFFLFPPDARACTQKINSGDPVQSGFGAPYNVLTSAKEMLMNVNCQSSSANLQLGNGSDNQYIYRYAYIWRNNAWQRMDVSGNKPAYGNNWFQGSANAPFTLTAEELASPQNHVIAFICSWQASISQWKCGCRDSNCNQMYWQLQKFGS